MNQVICDGCNVREGWEHRCHGEQSVVGGEQTYLPCECRECRELESLTAEEIRARLAQPVTPRSPAE